MAFESLSHRFTYIIPGFPREWFPLFYLYDADVPLFPLCYFHVLSKDVPPDKTPKAGDRTFGFVERIHPVDSGLEVSVICNKDLEDPQNSRFHSSVKAEVKERLGISNPVTINDVSTAFARKQAQANSLLTGLWRKIVSPAFGNSLPFGRLYDPVFGLPRMMASFYSPGGRKSEWIQAHYFCSRFGEKISVAPHLHQMDFYLLPTFQELTTNNLKLFSRFRSLSIAADDFHNSFCSVQNIGSGLRFSKFSFPYSGTVNTQNFMECIYRLNQNSIDPLIQCFNAFDKGPPRTIMFLQVFNDIKNKRWDPPALTSTQLGSIYAGLRGFYQPPKVISLYTQQCFGNASALPIDTWVQTFLKWPLKIHPKSKGGGVPKTIRTVFKTANNLGKVERLLWISAQTRKVHSSVCNDALWCVKYDSKGGPRGANPLACNACNKSIRNRCPAYISIADDQIVFNSSRGSNKFEIHTSAGNNTTRAQRFTLCEGEDDMYGNIHDDFTPVDDPSSFASYPRRIHKGGPLKVRDFVNIY